MPRDPAFDSTLAILREGYPFIWNRCQRFGSDIFTTRVMGKPTVCIHGPDAARLFYDESKLQRHGAVPRRVVTSLFGKHAVQTLDDAAHRHRKAVFLSLMTPTSVERLMDGMTQQWELAAQHWQRSPSVVLFDEALRVLTAAACEWAGVPLPRHELPRRAQQLGEMVDAFGGVGERLWKGKLARVSCERWAARQIQAQRRGTLRAAPHTALHAMASYRGPNGRPLDLQTAAVELLNVIRPTAAIAWYVADAAAALHAHPDARARLGGLDEDPAYEHSFVQEVRRFYPFTPYLGAKVRTSFEWKGHSFEEGTLVLLDVYGANRDPRSWTEPERFWPERFATPVEDHYDFIPQGGGDARQGHRCAGEDITLLALTRAVRFLTRDVAYELAPGQDLSLDLSRMPSRPSSGVVLRRVRFTG